MSQNLPEGALSELLYDDDLVLKSETIEALRDEFLKYKEIFESKSLKVNLGKTKVIVSGLSQAMACLKIKLVLVGSAA